MIFVPVVSPDSFVRVSRTVKGIDPNRSFPGPGTGRVVSNVPAIQNLIEFFAENSVEGVVDLHAFGEVFLLPWGHSLGNIEEQDWEDLQRLARASAAGTRYRIAKLTDFWEDGRPLVDQLTIGTAREIPFLWAWNWREDS